MSAYFLDCFSFVLFFFKLILIKETTNLPVEHGADKASIKTEREETSK